MILVLVESVKSGTTTTCTFVRLYKYKCTFRTAQTHFMSLQCTDLLQLDWGSPEVNQVLCDLVIGPYV